MPSEPTFSRKAAPVAKPLPLWILYPLFFTLIYVSHWSLLRLPYFWDEAGYYIPAALDFFRTGSLIPHSTLTNAHPPLPSIFLAEWWRLSGFVPIATRTLLCMVSAAALLAVFRLAQALAGSLAGAAVTLLTALYPIWFTQSTLAHADIFAAAFTLWALSCYFDLDPDRPANLATTAVLFALAALSKETAIVTPVVLAAWELTLQLTEPKYPRSKLWILALLAPILPLAAWYAYHFQQTGFIFGNPEFLRYNATANASPARILLSLWHRCVHLTFHMNLWVPVLSTAALLTARATPGHSSRATTRPVLLTLLVIILGNAFAFSILGGALLTRYLLPLYPLILLVCVAQWRLRLRQWPYLTALTAAAFLAALFLNPPYPFAPEDNLTYRDFVVLHQQAAFILQKRFPAATVLTAWPATTELEHPDLGYTHTPFKVVALDNFTFAELQKAAGDPGAYDMALIFSTKWAPPPGAFSFARHTERSDTKFFDFHQDATPAEAAALLHGEIVWQSHRGGEWAALLHFNRINEASLHQPR